MPAISSSDIFAIALREFTPDRVSQAYVAWLNNPQVNQYLESRFASHSLESTRAYVARMLEDPNQRMFGIYDGERHIGNIKLGSINRWHLHAEVGLLIAPEAWGQGVGTKAIALIEKVAFQEEGLHKLFAGVYAPNEASLKAFFRNGWTLAGTWRDHARLETGYFDCHLVEKLHT